MKTLRLPKKTEKATRSERIYAYENMVEDFDYNEQQALVDLHILPADFEDMDYYRTNEVLSAKPRDKRAVDPEAWLKSLGL
ncbi:hypothetical protein OQZ59_06265 [Lacticaseibacillus nasuensis]|nr:hypothetical protein [Lacticaseibacillus nasuensis]